MEIHDQINILDGQKEIAEEVLNDLKWLQKELMQLEDFNQDKERIPFRGDIFSRIVEKGIIIVR